MRIDKREKFAVLTSTRHKEQNADLGLHSQRFALSISQNTHTVHKIK